MHKIKELTSFCNGGERYMLSQLLNNAADYVRAVVAMETMAENIEGLEGEEWREERQDTDRDRTSAHNAFIKSVESVNRICDKYNHPHIYTGSTERRAYGDFAFELVKGIFISRH